MSILNNIKCHNDLLQLNENQREDLCAEIRQFLVEHVSKTGGHLASNLGVVELTVALETVFNTEKDRLVFDVGHQSYVHKLLTGRQADFDRLRSFGGIAGFPKPSESATDSFVAGHASSSVSIALGMARARTLSKEDYDVIVLLGDGAATGGMIYEGLNDAAESGESMVIVLNDNEMSIDRNVGGLARHLGRLRVKAGYLGAKQKYRNLLHKIPGGHGIYHFTRKIKDRIRRILIPTTIFENMGLTYLGPVDGHDTAALIQLLRHAKEMNRPVVVHVLTQKGKGYAPAEEKPSKFHGVGSFDPETGESPKKSSISFSDSFGTSLCEIASNDPRVCAITAAMPSGTGLIPFKKMYPTRFFDVGIAEEHAVSMAGGLAKQGMVPVVALYSTFMQRSYDMLMQDIGLLGLHVVFAVDRAGLVGEDGETHHGVFDVGFLRQIPGMRLLSPLTTAEQQQMLKWAISEYCGPVAIRYPRGSNRCDPAPVWADRGVVCHREGGRIALVTYGVLTDEVIKAGNKLATNGIDVTVLRLQTLAPLPDLPLAEHLSGISNVFIIEETCTGSGIHEVLAWKLNQHGLSCRFRGLDLGPDFVTHGDLKCLYQKCGLDSESITRYVMEVTSNEN